MHLLAAQPGGFVDDEGIIDLDQTPAEIIILSAADSALAALSVGVRLYQSQETGDSAEIRLANWMQLLKPAAYDLYEHKVLEHARVVVLSLLGGQNYWPYGFERLQAWAKGATDGMSRQLIIVPGDDAFDPELFDASTVSLEDCHRVWRYLREGGVDNSQQLVSFLAAQYLDADLRWDEPRSLPRCMLYMPAEARDETQPTRFNGGQASFAEWQQRWQRHGHPVQPVAVLLFYRSHLQSANTAMFDGLITALEQQSLNPLPVAIASLKDAESITLVNALVEQSNASLIINTTGFASNTVASPDLSSQPTDFTSPFARELPVLQLVLSSSTEEDWQQYSQGLRSRDIAMQVVLPEMDGRIVTRAVSFKAESHFDERCEFSVVRYALHNERAAFVAELAARHCSLARKENQDKRIALILANYPTKDGRIGNGVGLDTPASTVNILRALAEAGYPLGDPNDLPETGTALIESLLEAVTNNPNTLHQLPCWQSMALDEYLHYFRQLPEACQLAVYEQWGGPEDDIKCRQGRLMLSGIRIGETFVGIQPARGFNIDLVANYHDPDLIPPHNYLAFYFWLRHQFRAFGEGLTAVRVRVEKMEPVVSELAKGEEPMKRPLEKLHREVLYVPPSMKLTDLLVKMQSTRIHLALVVDEYGGTDGLVSLEDLVEEIVGDIEDEHDDEEPMFVRRSARIWEVDARTEIQDFAEETGIDLELSDEDSEFDTLGGIARAAKTASGGVGIPVYIGDQTSNDGKIRTLTEQVSLEARTRMLNPTWYEGMLKHGYEGVREIEACVTNTLGWSATTGQVTPWVFKQITETYVLDPDMRRRMAELNPKASARVANRLLEAHERNYWTPDPETLAALQAAGDELEDRLEGINAEAAA